MKAINRVALNTGIHYGRMLVTLGISLFTTRIVLNTLGSTDYGIFNLIAGVVAILAILNMAMSTSTQRFLSFYQGQGNLEKQKHIFSSSLVLHILISLIVVCLIEFAGVFLFDGWLNIPSERIPAARVVYHMMTITVFFSIVSVPFNASLIAHENMFWVAMVAIIEAVLKLFVAMLIVILGGDKLVAFSFFSTCVSIISCLVSALYCLSEYRECSFKRLFPINSSLFRELSNYAGWNLFGSLCSVSKDQGFPVLLNLFFGTVMNAAYGIAMLVATQLTMFSSALIRALSPQIMKSEGAGDRQRMLRLAMMASKFGFFLLALVAIPCIFELKSILAFWLHDVPEYTRLFCTLLLISIMINHLTVGLQSGLQAVGRVRIYQIAVGTIVLCNLPFAYLILRAGYPVYYPLIAFWLVELVANSVRIFLLRYVAGLSIRMFFRRVIFKEIIPVLVVCGVCFLITRSDPFPFRFILTGIASVVVFPLVVYFTGLCADEKAMFLRFVSTAKGILKSRTLQRAKS